MPKNLTLFLLTLVCSIIPGGYASAFQCNVCHSKNPAMVRMHRALQGRDCFSCHNIGEKLMGKSQPKDRESLLKRRVSDQHCTECHKV